MPKYRRDWPKVNADIDALSQLFPVFRAKSYDAHLPLALGIDKMVVEMGVLTVDEARNVFRAYCSRLAYQRALATGGARYALDGITPVGEVTPDQQKCAATVVGTILAKREANAKAAKAEWRAARLAVQKPNGAPVIGEAAAQITHQRPRLGAIAHPDTILKPATITTTVTKPAKLSLSGLRDAWRARQQAI